jgi:serine O-acetyltransferase
MRMTPDHQTRLDIAPIISELQNVRVRSLEQRNRKTHPPKLPSRNSLQTIIEGLSTVLYPNRLGDGDVTDEGIDYYVGHILDETLRHLRLQVQRELRFTIEQTGNLNPDRLLLANQSLELTRAFAKNLPKVRALLDSDLQAAFEGDPAARSADEVLVCYPSIAAIINHRLAHELYLLDLPLIARMIAEIAHSVTGIDIHPGAQIGPSFFIDHGTHC